MKRILYVLARPDYFARAECGSISHAVGLAGGMAAQGTRVDLVSGPDPHGYLDGSGSHLHPVARRRLEPAVLWLERCRRRMVGLAGRHRYDTIVVRYSLPAAGYLGGTLRRLGVPWGFEVNSLTTPRWERRGRPLVARACRLAEHRSFAGASYMYAVSELLVEQIAAAPAIRADQVIVSPNGGPPDQTERFASAPRLRARPGAPLHLVYFGGYNRYYDFDYLVDEVVRLNGRRAGPPRCRLVFFGGGALASRVRHHAQRHDVVSEEGRFRFGDLHRHPVFAQRTVLALPPLFLAHGSPIKFYEYLSTGLPVVAPEGGLLSEFPPGVRAVIGYDGTRSGALADRVERLAGSDEALRANAEVVRSIAPGTTWQARAARLLDQIRARIRDGGGACGPPAPAGGEVPSPVATPRQGHGVREARP